MSAGLLSLRWGHPALMVATLEVLGIQLGVPAGCSYCPGKNKYTKVSIVSSSKIKEKMGGGDPRTPLSTRLYLNLCFKHWTNQSNTGLNPWWAMECLNTVILDTVLVSAQCNNKPKYIINYGVTSHLKSSNNTVFKVAHEFHYTMAIKTSSLKRERDSVGGGGGGCAYYCVFVVKDRAKKKKELKICLPSQWMPKTQPSRQVGWW